MSHTSRSLVAFLVGVATIVAGCGDDDDDDDSDGAAAVSASDLEGYQYTATEVTPNTLAEDTTFTLTFDATTLAAHAGCNTMSGSWELDGDKLLVGQLAMTAMACSDQLETQDAWVTELLQGEPTVAVDGDVLTMTGGEAIVTFGERTDA